MRGQDCARMVIPIFRFIFMKSITHSVNAVQKPIYLAITAALMTMSQISFAQENANLNVPNSAANDLATVVVTASRSQAKVTDMALSTTIISNEDIQKSSAQTLDQLLRNVPGFNFTGVPSTQTDPTGQQTKMRGLGNAKVLMLVDGVPVMDPFYLTTQWYKIPLSQIDHVEVIRGGNSSLWGNMAVAGVVNIVTKRPNNNDGQFTASGGTSGSNNLSFSQNIKISDALSFNIALDRLNQMGYNTILPSQQWRFAQWQPTSAVNTNAQVTAFFKPSADLSGYLRVGYHVQNQEINYIFGQNEQKNPDISASITKNLEDNSSITGTAWAQYVNFDKFNGASCYWQTTGTTKCPSASSSSLTPAQVNTNVVQYYTQNSRQGYREQGSSLIYSKNLAKASNGVIASVQIGADFRRLSATDNELFYSAPTLLTKLQNFNSSTYGKGQQTFTGIFTQLRFVPLDPLEITFSAREDNWQNTNRTNTRTNNAGVTVGGAQPDLSKTAFDPSLAIRYAVNNDAAVRGAVYKAFRAPGFNNTMRTYGSPNPTIANPALTPETLLGRELGVDFKHDGLSASATYFLYDISNMIATYKVANYASAPALVQTICGVNFVNCGGTTGYANFYTNNQKGQSQGLELILGYKYSQNLSFNASFTRTLSILTSETSNITTPLHTQLAGTPANTGNVSVTWKPTSRLQTYLSARYIGPMYYDVTSVGGPYQQGGNVVYDGSIRFAATPTIDLFANGTNLGNHVYSEGTYTHNQPWGITLSQARNLNVGVQFRF